MRYGPPYAIALMLLGIPAAALAGGGTVTGVSLERAGEATELDVDLRGSAQPHLFTLEHPYRVVLDLAPATLAAGARTPQATPGVMAVRLAPHGEGGVRIVLELARAEPAHLSLVPDGNGHLHVSVRVGAPAAAGAVAPRAVAEPHVVRALDAAPSHPLVIAVDAGHGGEDPGATGKYGTHEKNVTLAVARALAQMINAEPGMRAYLTRDGDYFVELRSRIVKAARAQADLFVSVHADAVENREITGASVYVLSAHGASSEAARRLADRENAADLVGGVSLKDKDPLLASVLLDLSQSAAMSASEVAAESVLKELDGVGDIRKSQVQRAGFLVLKSPDIPSMLVETAYITNPDEERRLKDPAHQREIAAAILAGLKSYFRAHPPAGSRLSPGPMASTAEPQ